VNADRETVGPQYAEGVRCPECGCGHWRVLKTRKGPGTIVRRRECRHCGRRLTTREKVTEAQEDAPPGAMV